MERYFQMRHTWLEMHILVAFDCHCFMEALGGGNACLSGPREQLLQENRSADDVLCIVENLMPSVRVRSDPSGSQLRRLGLWSRQRELEERHQSGIPCNRVGQSEWHSIELIVESAITQMAV